MLLMRFKNVVGGVSSQNSYLATKRLPDRLGDLMPLGQTTSDMKGNMSVSTLTATDKGATRGIYIYIYIKGVGTWCIMFCDMFRV